LNLKRTGKKSTPAVRPANTAGHPIRGWTTENGFRFVVALYSIRMLFPAGMLAFSSEAALQFETIAPHWARWALAISQALGAVLINFRRLFYVGGVILLADLAAAVAVHLRVGEHPTGFYILAGVLVLLVVLRRLVITHPPANQTGPRVLTD
jgi:hypothetical protein